VAASKPTFPLSELQDQVRYT